MSQFPQLEEAVKNFSKEMAHTEVDEQESQHGICLYNVDNSSIMPGEDTAITLITFKSKEEKTHLKELNKEQKKAHDIIRIGKLTM